MADRVQLTDSWGRTQSHKRQPPSGGDCPVNVIQGQTARLRAIIARTRIITYRLIGVTCKESIPIRGLKTFNLQYPQSITYLIPSIVREVSAMLVETTHFREPGGVFSKIRAWKEDGQVARKQASSSQFTAVIDIVDCFVTRSCCCRRQKFLYSRQSPRVIDLKTLSFKNSDPGILTRRTRTRKLFFDLAALVAVSGHLGFSLFFFSIVLNLQSAEEAL